MATIFHLSEIIKFAVEKEEESMALYEKLAENASQEALKELFERLAKEEAGHKAFYEKMMRAADKAPWPGTQESQEYDAYMRELIVSSRSVKAISDLSFDDIHRVMDYAIAREKDSVLFYTGLKGYVPEKDQNGIDEIIKEEARHVAILTKAKEQF